MKQQPSHGARHTGQPPRAGLQPHSLALDAPKRRAAAATTAGGALDALPLPCLRRDAVALPGPVAVDQPVSQSLDRQHPTPPPRECAGLRAERRRRASQEEPFVGPAEAGVCCQERGTTTSTRV